MKLQGKMTTKLAPLAAFLLLAAALVAVNVLFAFVPIRVDITEEGLFTLSKGSKEIVAGFEEPTTIKLYYSESLENIPVAFKSYSTKVIELLREYQSYSDGMVSLELINPEPDTEDEEWATRYGLSPARLPNGTNLLFGMVVLSADREAVVPFFDPRREKFLEYEISQTLLRVRQESKPKIGVLSYLPVAGFGNPRVPGRGQEDWVFLQELKKNFEVEMLPPDSLVEIGADFQLVVLIHPKLMPRRVSYALDQYLMRGGKLMALVDPNSRMDQGGQGQFGSPTNSELKYLFEAWDLKFDSMKIVGDHKLATKVNSPQHGVIDYPVWLSVTSANLAQDQVITNELESLTLIDSGAFIPGEKFPYTFTPLISTSDKAAFVDFATIRMVNPVTIAKMIEPDGTIYALSGLITGTFKSAYPDGPPPTPKANGNPAEEEKAKLPERKLPHLAQGEKETSVLVVGDADFMADQFSVERVNFFGNIIMRPINDNLNFVLNAVEFLAGDQALIHIRSRGKFSRPFTLVAELETKAAERYLKEEQQLSDQLESVKQKLAAIEREKPEGQQVLLSPEQLEAVKSFRLEEQRTRKALKEVRKVLRQDIETLGNQLLAFNLLLMPLLVSLVGFVIILRRTRRKGGRS